MPQRDSSFSVAVIGAGLAGAACAAGLRDAAASVTLFDKSMGVGGRMATRRATWTDATGAEQVVEFDHGAQAFSARHPRFRAVVKRAQAAGVLVPWAARVHAPLPSPMASTQWVATPTMPAFARHLIGDLPAELGEPVQRLVRSPEGWRLMRARGHVGTPFDAVVLAMPPVQAAVLLAGHHDEWADTLAALPSQASWTLMAVTDDVDWPWDAVEPARGPLAWVARNDRKPGRCAPPGLASWVAQATPAWSEAHLEEDTATVSAALRDALRRLWPPGAAPRWHHAVVHRWRYALPGAELAGQGDGWWDARLRLGVCGDHFSGPQVEDAWRSGDELADLMAASTETRSPPADQPLPQAA